MKSRNLQNVNHIIGGLRDVLLILVGVLFAQSEWIYGVITAVIIFLTTRVSSEIFYRILKQVEKESHNDK